MLEIERWFATRAITPWEGTGELPKGGSLKGLHDTLRAALNDAVRYGVISDNPCTRVGRSRDHARAHRRGATRLTFVGSPVKLDHQRQQTSASG
ncbi:MAG: hypothetical protein ACKO7U_11060 [Actinomycetota bacterium]